MLSCFGFNASNNGISHEEDVALKTCTTVIFLSYLGWSTPRKKTLRGAKLLQKHCNDAEIQNLAVISFSIKIKKISMKYSYVF